MSSLSRVIPPLIPHSVNCRLKNVCSLSLSVLSLLRTQELTVYYYEIAHNARCNKSHINYPLMYPNFILSTTLIQYLVSLFSFFFFFGLQFNESYLCNEFQIKYMIIRFVIGKINFNSLHNCWHLVDRMECRRRK